MLFNVRAVRVLKTLTAFMLCLFLMSCAEKEIKVGDYISITATGKTRNEKGDLTVSLYAYDIKTDNAQKIIDFPYTAQYSLGAVDLYDNAAYCAKGITIGERTFDQLFRYDLETKTEEQITDNLFAINYIIPIKDRILFVACKKGERNLCLGSYDKRNKSIRYWGDDKDTNIENICVDQNTKKIYVVTYSEKEDNYNFAHHTSGDDFIIADHHVREIDFDLEEERELFSLSNKFLRMLVINGKKLLAIYDEKYCDDINPSKCIYFDIETDSKENFVLPDHRVQKGDAAFSRDGKELYMLTTFPEDEGRSLYRYNIEDKSYNLMFRPVGGFINNCQLIRSADD